MSKRVKYIDVMVVPDGTRWVRQEKYIGASEARDNRLDRALDVEDSYDPLRLAEPAPSFAEFLLRMVTVVSDVATAPLTADAAHSPSHPTTDAQSVAPTDTA